MILCISDSGYPIENVWDRGPVQQSPTPRLSRKGKGKGSDSCMLDGVLHLLLHPVRLAVLPSQLSKATVSIGCSCCIRLSPLEAYIVLLVQRWIHLIEGAYSVN